MLPVISAPRIKEGLFFINLLKFILSVDEC